MHLVRLCTSEVSEVVVQQNSRNLGFDETSHVSLFATIVTFEGLVCEVDQLSCTKLGDYPTRMFPQI